MRLIVAFVALMPFAGAIAQQAPPDDLFFNREHAEWPSPETLVRDLHSQREETRIKALRLFGLADPQLRLFSASTGVRIDLQYAALGDDGSLQAVVALTAVQYTFAAVARQTPHGWERLGVAACWCKYESNMLRAFLELRPAGPPDDQRFELVLRNSGGGTGIYSQTESHFRIHNGMLKRVISFESARRACPAAPVRPCSVTTRQLTGSLLVEAQGQFDGSAVPEIVFTLRELQARYLTRITCTPYEWDQSASIYRKKGPATACSGIKR